MDIHAKVSNIYCKNAQNAHCIGGKCTLPHKAPFSSCYNPLQPIHWQPPRVDIVLGFFRIGTLAPPSSPPHARVSPPPLVPGGRTHSRQEGGGGGPNSDEGTDTVVLEVYMYFVVYINEYNDDF